MICRTALDMSFSSFPWQANCTFRGKKGIMPLLTLEEIQESVPLFKGRAGGRAARILMRWLNITSLNDLYDRNAIASGPDFAAMVLQDLGVRYEVMHAERLKSIPDGPFIVISNHPYGSLDGVIMIDLFGHLRPDFKVMVNGILSRIETLEGNFINVTPTPDKPTAPAKDSIQGIKEAVRHVRDGHPLGIFPSGAVSDLSLKDRCVRDRQWQEPVIRLIQKLRVPVIPIHFLDGNSPFYYALGLLSWKVRLLRLPSEVFNKRGKPARVAIGNPISVSLQDDLDDLRNYLRDSVYKLE